VELLDGQLEICWLTDAPAPEVLVVLELMSCRCSRKKCDKYCPCVMNGFHCTPAHKLQECTNIQDDDDDGSSDLDESDSDIVMRNKTRPK